jgi:hypothetical protein
MRLISAGTLHALTWAALAVFALPALTILAFAVDILDTEDVEDRCDP